MTEPTPDAPPVRPLLRVVRGTPSPEELAALVAVLASRGGAPETAPVPVRRWRSTVRAPLPAPGAGAWRGTGLPG